MQKLICLLVSALAIASSTLPAWSWLIPPGDSIGLTGSQPLLSSSGSVVSSTLDNYIPLGSRSLATSIYKSITFPVAGTLKSLKTRSSVALTSTKTYTITVYINGSSTGVSCTISSSSVNAICDWAGNVSVSAGDYGVILVHPTSAPTQAIITASVGFTPTTTNDRIVAASVGSNTFATGSTQVIEMGASSGPGTLASGRQTAVVPDGGTFDNLYINSGAPGAAASGKQYTYTVLKNGSATTLTKAIVETATSASDTTHSFSVTAGNDVEFQAVPASTPTASDTAFGMRFLATTTGHHIYTNSNVTPSQSATQYMNVTGAVSSANTATEANAQNVTHSQTFKAIQVKVNAAPGTAGSGKQWVVTLRVNGANSALTCTILNTATTCSASGTVAVNDNDLVNISTVPTGTPNGPSMGIGLLATR